MKIYLAGPMTGIKDFNFPAFRDWADILRAKGHEVFSPAEKDEERHGKGFNVSSDGNAEALKAKGFSLRQAMREDLNWILDHAEAIALMPGWETSEGADIEERLGRYIKLRIISL